MEQTIELTAPLPTGERTFEVRLAPELAPDGSVASVVAVSRDVTERTRREAEQARLYQALLEREERLGALVRRVLGSREDERRRPRGAELLGALTPREREVLRLLAQGLTTREIARRLVISPATVKSHAVGLYAKLGVANRTQAALRAVELGLLGE